MRRLIADHDIDVDRDAVLRDVYLDVRKACVYGVPQYIFKCQPFEVVANALNTGAFVGEQYHVATALVDWLLYREAERMPRAAELFDLVNPVLCSRDTMGTSKKVNTGNAELDVLIKQFKLAVLIHSDHDFMQLSNNYGLDVLDVIKCD